MYQVVAENNDWVIFKVENALDVCSVVDGANWCIADEDNIEESQYWFDHYTKNGELDMYIARRLSTDDRQINNICIISTKDRLQVQYIDSYDNEINPYKISNFINIVNFKNKLS